MAGAPEVSMSPGQASLHTRLGRWTQIDTKRDSSSWKRQDDPPEAAGNLCMCRGHARPDSRTPERATSGLAERRVRGPRTTRCTHAFVLDRCAPACVSSC